MENLKLPIALVVAMGAQLAGGVWWVSQQASTIQTLEETVNTLSAQNEVQDKVNMQRDIQNNAENIDEMIDILAEIYEDMEDADNELWDDIEMLWEDLDGMTSHMMEIIKIQSRMKTLENSLDYLTKSPMYSAGK